jgi:hypothetical protein
MESKIPESQKLLKDVLSITEDVKIVFRNQKNFNIRFAVIEQNGGKSRILDLKITKFSLDDVNKKMVRTVSKSTCSQRATSNNGQVFYV